MALTFMLPMFMAFMAFMVDIVVAFAEVLWWLKRVFICICSCR